MVRYLFVLTGSRTPWEIIDFPWYRTLLIGDSNQMLSSLYIVPIIAYYFSWSLSPPLTSSLHVIPSRGAKSGGIVGVGSDNGGCGNFEIKFDILVTMSHFNNFEAICVTSKCLTNSHRFHPDSHAFNYVLVWSLFSLQSRVQMCESLYFACSLAG